MVDKDYGGLLLDYQSGWITGAFEGKRGKTNGRIGNLLAYGDRIS
jgi:hypothetical protein